MRFIGIHDRIFYKLDREKLWKEQGCRCYYCRRQLRLSEATVDHVVPIKERGFHSVANSVVACYTCNQTKGCKPVEEFEPDEFELKINESLKRIEERVCRAEYNLSFDSKGSFKKWKRFHKKG